MNPIGPLGNNGWSELLRGPLPTRGITMTLDEVRKAIDDIRDCAHDPEAAHSLEDTLHQKVLHAIVASRGRDWELAAEALKTTGIRFKRWCA